MTIIDLLQELGIDYREFGQHHHCTQGWVNVDCPGCSPGSNSFKRGINLQWGNTNCWSCGPAKLHDLLREITGQSQSVLLKGLRIDRPTTETATIPRKALKTPAGLTELLPCHKAYLKGRGLNPDDLVRLWDIQGVGLHPKLAWRIYLPIIYQGRTVSWTTRSIVNTGRRYINAARDEEALPAKSLLYGEDYCRHAIIITEGPFDAIRIGPGAVATMGVAYSQEQLAKMTKYPVRVICFDAEINAQNRAHQLLETLCVLPGETKNVVLDSKDPGSATQREIDFLRKFLE